MDKDIVAYEVYRTTDYGKFVMVDTNREVTKTRVKKILESINNVGFRRVPIVVNENMEIMDGQGRFEALKRIGLPIDYVVDPGADIDVCRQLNIGQTNWKYIDYINSYSDEGNENYKNLLELVESYKQLGLQVVIGTCYKEIVLNGWVINRVNTGEFKLSKKEMNEVSTTLDFLSSVSKEISKINGSKRMAFTMFGWIINQEGVDIERVRRIITDKYPLIIPCADIVSSLTQISDLYNKGLKDKSKRMYFEILYKEGK